MMRKKTIVMIIIFLLCFAYGCADNTETTVKSTVPSPHPEPPQSLSFRSIEEYQCFFLSVDFSDDDFQEYIEERGFDMNGIRSKDDVNKLKQKLASVPFPSVPNADLTAMEILPEYDQLYLRYELNGDDVCTFTVDYTNMTQINQITEAEQNIQLWNDASYDYSYDAEQKLHKFFENNNGCTVLCRYYGEKESALEVIDQTTVYSTAVQ